MPTGTPDRFGLALLSFLLLASLPVAPVNAQSRQDKNSRLAAGATQSRPQSVSRDEMMKDWREAVALAEEFEPVRWESAFEKDPLGFVARFQEFWKKFPAFWERVNDKYERNTHGKFPAFEELTQPLDLNTTYASAYNTLLSAVGHNEDVAEWCEQVGTKKYRAWARSKEKPPHPHKVELYLDYATTALQCFQAGKALDPEKGWDENIELARQAVELQTRKFEENLGHPDMQWPPDNPDWHGEGDPAALCAAAHEFLMKHESSWGDAYQDDLAEPIAVSLYSSDWNVMKKAPLTQEPTQYTLDFTVAFSSKSESRFAYRFHYSFYTKEELGVPKAPPFVRCNPHQYAHFKMLASAVPFAGGSGGGSSTSGGLGSILWLALILANILAGLLAAAPLINSKAPQLESLYKNLTPLRNILGVVALAIGLVSFLRTLVILQPLADVLPQLSAVLAGLFLGKEILLKEPEEAAAEKPEEAEGETAETEDEEKQEDKAAQAREAVEDAAEAAGEAATAAAKAAQDLLIQHKEKIEKLEMYQVPVGIGCLVLGVLHLVLGGFPLF